MIFYKLATSKANSETTRHNFLQGAMTTRLLLVGCLAAFISLVSATAHSTTVTGRALCRINGQSVPLKETTVKVFDDDLIDNLVGEAATGMDGRFSVSGVARDIFGVPNIYIAVVHTYSTLIEKNGILTKSDILNIDGLFGIPRFHRTTLIPINDTIDYGDIFITNDHCRAYVHFYDAIIDYKSRTEMQLPYETLRVCTHALIHGGTPYALLDKAFVPRDYPLNLETAKHELAHTVRHTLVRKQYMIDLRKGVCIKYTTIFTPLIGWKLNASSLRRYSFQLLSGA